MAVPEKYMEIMAKFQKALKTEDFTEIDSIPLKDLKLAKAHLVNDKGSAYYPLLIDKIAEMELMPSQHDGAKEPLIFMSYDTRDIDLVKAIDDVLQRVFNNKVKTFIAKRDIKAGDDAFKKMLHDSLAKCAVVLALCTKRSVTSSWLWFESGAGFEKSGLIPIWSGVNPQEFKAPMTIFQGKNIQDKGEIHELLSKIAEVTKFDTKDITITDAEFDKLVKISNELDATSNKNESNRIEGPNGESNLADIKVGFEKKEITSALHTYSLLFSVKWQGPRDQDFFNISLMWPKAIKINKIIGFERGEDEEIDGILYEELSLFVDKRLWPHKTIKAIGGKAAAQLEYIFDNATYTKVRSDVTPTEYKLYYKFYSQEWAPIEGEVSFKELNFF